MTTIEKCGEHFQVGQGLSSGWPVSICGRAKDHEGTHGLVPDAELIPEPESPTFTASLVPPNAYDQGLSDGYLSGLHKAATLICRQCILGLPELCKDRITYPEPTWLHKNSWHNQKCPATVIYEEIREAENAQ